MENCKLHPWRNVVTVPWRKLMRYGLLTRTERENQGLRQGAFRKGDRLLRHSEVSERRQRRVWAKDTEEWLELGTSQERRLAVNMQLCRGLASQPPPARTAEGNRHRGSQKLSVFRRYDLSWSSAWGDPACLSPSPASHIAPGSPLC